jgi:gamma-glutamylcyclotransferase (GGCT)/AIG2-like uncharacterized protein YtfP
MMESERLPFFVYGSLLPGQLYHWVWGESVVWGQRAVLRYGRLYDLGDYPMLVETGDDVIQGMVMEVNTADYDNVLARLDALESYFPDRPEESIYVRMAREVWLDDGTAVTAWVYIGQMNFISHLPVVPNGDWAVYVSEQ